MSLGVGQHGRHQRQRLGLHPADEPNEILSGDGRIGVEQEQDLGALGTGARGTEIDPAAEPDIGLGRSTTQSCSRAIASVSSRTSEVEKLSTTT